MKELDSDLSTALDLNIVSASDLVPSKRRAPHTILLVEDDDSTLLVMSRLLKRMGYGVHTANCISGALSSIEQNPVDFVISDIGLPDGTGYDLMREIKIRCNVVGIALTGFDGIDDLDESIKAGFAGHLVKPIDFTLLESMLASLTPK